MPGYLVGDLANGDVMVVDVRQLESPHVRSVRSSYTYVVVTENGQPLRIEAAGAASSAWSLPAAMPVTALIADDELMNVLEQPSTGIVVVDLRAKPVGVLEPTVVKRYAAETSRSLGGEPGGDGGLGDWTLMGRRQPLRALLVRCATCGNGMEVPFFEQGRTRCDDCGGFLKLDSTTPSV